MQKPLVQATIKISCSDSVTASVIYGALKPDDKPLPEGLWIETRLEGSEIVSEIRCERGLASFLATIDDVFMMAGLAEKIHRTTRHGQEP